MPSSFSAPPGLGITAENSNQNRSNFLGSEHVNDDAALYVNEVMVGVSEERRSAHRSRPLRRRIGRRDKFWRHFARRTKSGIIKGRQMLLHGAARGLASMRLLPFSSRDRALLVG